MGGHRQQGAQDRRGPGRGVRPQRLERGGQRGVAEGPHHAQGVPWVTDTGQSAEGRERDDQLRFVVAVQVPAPGGLRRYAGPLLAVETGPCLRPVRVYLQGQRPLGGEHLQQERQPAHGVLGRLPPAAGAALGLGRRTRMGAQPQLRGRPAGRVLTEQVVDGGG